MAKLSQARKDWLETQYILSLKNDGNWYRDTRAAVEERALSRFRTITWPYVQKLRTGLHDNPDKLDWPYILARMWMDEGHPLMDFRKNGGMTEWGTYLDLFPPPTPPIPPELCTMLPPGVACTELDTNEQEKTMTNTAPAFETKHMIFGQDASKMTQGELISAIKNLEAEIDNLKAIRTPSKAINARIDELNGMLKNVVAILDKE